MAPGSALLAPAELLRSGCGLLDRSERGKLSITGAGAAEFLSGQVTNDVLALTPGQGLYAALLDHKGRMQGDLRVLCCPAGGPEPEGSLWLDTERPALQAVFDALRRTILGHPAELGKRTLQRSLHSLVGPTTDEVLTAAGAAPPAAGEHATTAAVLAGVPVLLVRTDLGVDVIAEAERAAAVAGALREAGAGEVAAPDVEVLRVESGRPRWGLDIDASTIPQEAGLNERAVSFTKGCYVGQETVARLHYKGRPTRHLRGLMLSGVVASGTELRLGERVVGRVGTVARSPHLGPIGLALVRREAEPGAVLDAGEGTRATVVELPFPAAASG